MERKAGGEIDGFRGSDGEEVADPFAFVGIGRTGEDGTKAALSEGLKEFGPIRNGPMFAEEAGDGVDMNEGAGREEGIEGRAGVGAGMETEAGVLGVDANGLEDAEVFENGVLVVNALDGMGEELVAAEKAFVVDMAGADGGTGKAGDADAGIAAGEFEGEIGSGLAEGAKKAESSDPGAGERFFAFGKGKDAIDGGMALEHDLGAGVNAGDDFSFGKPFAEGGENRGGEENIAQLAQFDHEDALRIGRGGS